ncbi:MAG: zinc metalloprotease HtpX [Candidatus Saccharicenans sp.]|nr:zinc metalloprotease HtpX [Candidatus Saccharicenans sp.]
MSQRKVPPPAFWEIQRKQKVISALLFIVLFIFYFLSTGVISAAILFSADLFIPGFSFLAASFFKPYVVILISVSFILTLINFISARKKGSLYILKNLRACTPDPEDRYHLTFLNILEEMKISSGIPVIRGYIIPTVNLNSLSLIDRDGKPAIVITEGLLGEASRDELQAVVAHETAHILSDDTFLLTLVCSIASFYEKLIDSLEKERDLSEDMLKRPDKGTSPVQPLVYLAGIFSCAILKLFITFLSQKREMLADATAVELGRDPMALARIIYKAHLANSFLGESNLFTPLFLVPPDSREIKETIWDKLFNTHPPLTIRLKNLAAMAHRELKDVIDGVRKQEENREKLRLKYTPVDDLPTEYGEKLKKLQLQARVALEKDRVWFVRESGGAWNGPYLLGELITLPFFTPALRVKNLKENLEGPARSFPQVRFALYRQLKKQPIDPNLKNRCPFCLTDLDESFYEGVKIKKCSGCRGKLVSFNHLEKIFARKELSFSERLRQKALNYKEALLKTDLKIPVVKEKPPALCPECGLQFTLRPFNYFYLMPVYKCYNCQLIWFEDEELEILQLLVEEKIRSWYRQNPIE